MDGLISSRFNPTEASAAASFSLGFTILLKTCRNPVPIVEALNPLFAKTIMVAEVSSIDNPACDEVAAT